MDSIKRTKLTLYPAMNMLACGLGDAMYWSSADTELYVLSKNPYLPMMFLASGDMFNFDNIKHHKMWTVVNRK